jgi:hypothetical protein
MYGALTSWSLSWKRWKKLDDVPVWEDKLCKPWAPFVNHRGTMNLTNSAILASVLSPRDILEWGIQCVVLGYQGDLRRDSRRHQMKAWEHSNPWCESDKWCYPCTPGKVCLRNIVNRRESWKCPEQDLPVACHWSPLESVPYWFEVPSARRTCARGINERCVEFPSITGEEWTKETKRTRAAMRDVSGILLTSLKNCELVVFLYS